MLFLGACSEKFEVEGRHNQNASHTIKMTNRQQAQAPYSINTKTHKIGLHFKNKKIFKN